MGSKAFIALMYVIAGLLAVVIFIGLVQQKLDPNGTAVALCGVLSGLIGGLVLGERQKGGGKRGDES